MTLTPDPERLANAREMQPRMQAAIEASDAKALLSILTTQKRVEFTIGKTYRLLVYGAATAPPVEAQDVKRLDQALGRLTGFDAANTVTAADVQEIVATYGGRRPSPGSPHVFRFLSGQIALLADMDLLAWRLA